MDVVITYETLFDLLRREKGRAELQELPKDFYGRVLLFLREKQASVADAGGFGAPQAQKLLIQYQNAQKIIRELYERRERKILEMCLNKARTASNLIDTSALLPEERPLFEEGVSFLASGRDRLLEPLLRGDLPEGASLPSEEPADGGVAGPDDGGVGGASGRASDDRVAGVVAGDGRDEGPASTPAAPAGSGAAPPTGSLPDQCRVRFVAPVQRFLGLHGEVLGPFAVGAEASLSGKIVTVLLKKRLVELLEPKG